MATIASEPQSRVEFVRPLFLADWHDATFVHYEAAPADLRPHVPFELDLYEGKAYVSLVAFTQRRLRPRAGGRPAALLSAPLASHPFLNVRTYVRHGSQRGIYFICEWIPNRLAALLGPPLYGLPYRLGRLRYRHDACTGLGHYEVDAGAKLAFEVKGRPPATDLGPAAPGTLDHFLLERYTAFTRHCGVRRRFCVRHAPWPQRRVHVQMLQTGLLDRLGLPLASMTPIAANYSPGVCDVCLSAPRRLPDSPRTRRPTASARNSRDTFAWMGWLPPPAMLALCLSLRVILSGWQLMWLVAICLYIGCKWQTFWTERKLAREHLGRSLAYLLAWPGMDARRFLNPAHGPATSTPLDWIFATGKTLIGAALLWGVCRLLPRPYPLLVGWTGMLGMTLLLHFGFFELLSLMWRSVGIDTRPVMDRPLAATSLADFWGRRWNTAFHTLAHQLAFRPLTHPLGPAAALLASFVISGLVHDLVISVPARGGLGLPTAYFLCQGAAVLIERSRLGIRLGLARGARGRLFAGVIAAGPAFLLFHPPFVIRVFLPFLGAIGAIPK